MILRANPERMVIEITAKSLSPLGIYIHVPFCLKKCGYCDFYSTPFSASAISDYTDALIKQIRSNKNKLSAYSADTVYFGGGTPSLLPPRDFQRIMDALSASTAISEKCEITLEINPATADLQSLASYFNSGANRLSIGMQSSHDNVLSMCGRLHKHADTAETVLLARQAGFDNISLDLIYGMPGEPESSFLDSAKSALDIGIEHISCYMLKLSENAPMSCKFPAVSFPDDDTLWSIYLSSAELFEKSGVFQYEISNFAKPGRESRHNRKYWDMSEYIGFGPAAHSFFEGRRFYVPPNLSRFMSDPENAFTGFETVSRKEREAEYLMLKLRTTDGIAFSEFYSLFGVDFMEKYGSKLNKYTNYRHVCITENSCRLTRSGMFVSNAILSDIIEFDN